MRPTSQSDRHLSTDGHQDRPTVITERERITSHSATSPLPNAESAFRVLADLAGYMNVQIYRFWAPAPGCGGSVLWLRADALPEA